MCGIYHGAEGDEADERVLRDEADGDDDGIAERLELLLIETGIDDEKEHGRDLRRPGEGVLDGSILWEQLRREVGVRDVLVMRGKRVALQTKWTDPQLAADVDLAGGYMNKVLGG